MGRLRIKRKEKVVPFRQTMAYRLLLVTASAVLFIIMFFQATGNLRSGNRTAGIIAAVVGMGAAVTIFYNLDRARYAKISDHASKRIRRR